jgi:N-acetylmuramoyl-L-alanine amidase
MLPMNKIKVVILDAGHGGVIDGVYQTKGKRSPKWDDNEEVSMVNILYEGVSTRLVREELERMLKKEGIKFFFANEGRKDTALSERVKFANSIAKKYGASNCLYISIHHDAFKLNQGEGYSVFTTPGQTDSDIYAEAYMEEMAKLFPDRKPRTDDKDGDMDKEKNFYVIRETICPAILTENFFMTHEYECKEILMKKQGRRKIAEAHFNMIKRFV